MENEKKADNIVVDNKKEINNIDLEVDHNKKILDTLDEMENDFYTLKKCVERCVELLNVSIKGENIQRKLNAISEENDSSYSESMKDINEHRDEVTSRIKELYKEKDILNDKLRKEQVELEAKKERENQNDLHTEY